MFLATLWIISRLVLNADGIQLSAIYKNYAQLQSGGVLRISFSNLNMAWKLSKANTVQYVGRRW